MAAVSIAEEAVEALDAFYGDPVLFVREILGAEPEPWQEKFLRTAAESPRTAVASAHGTGKTLADAWLILWWLSTHFPSIAAVTAPSAAQIEAALWPALRTWHGRMKPEFRDLFEMTSEKLFMKDAPSEAFAIWRTASRERPEAMQGLHAENLLFLVDEGSGVPDAVYITAFGALSTRNSKIVITSNPTRTTGFFYDVFSRDKDGLWQKFHVSAFDSKYSRHGQLIDIIRSRYGENSDEWNIRILGQFPVVDNDRLIPRPWVEAAFERDVAPLDVAPVWGVDVARFGSDRTSLCKRMGNVLLEPPKWWTGKGLLETAYRIRDEYDATEREMRPEEIVVDAIGLGAGVAEKLRELKLPAVDVNVSELPSFDARDQFMRLRDYLWWRTREWFEARNCRIPDPDTWTHPDRDEERRGRESMRMLVHELTLPRYEYSTAGKRKIESKEQLKSAGERSPDLADGFVLSLYPAAITNFKKSDWERDISINTSWVR